MAKDALALQNESTFNRLRNFLNSENTELVPKDNEILERWKFAYDQLQIEKKHAVAIRLKKVFKISESLAYLDIFNAKKLFNPLNRHDIEFERIWLVNQIKDDILTMKKMANVEKRSRILERLYDRFYKAIGLDKDEIERIDPELLGNNILIAQFVLGDQKIEINLDENRVVSKGVKDKLLAAMYGDITIEDAQILINKEDDGNEESIN